MLAKTFIFETMITNLIHDMKTERIYDAAKILLGVGIGVGITALFNKFYSPLARQNRDLRVKVRILGRQKKSLENRSERNLLRGIQIGEERSKNK